METSSTQTHKGPSLGILAVIFALLFNAGLSFVISLSGAPPYYPGPWESSEVIVSYFQNHSHDVLMCGFFQFGAAIPLGIFAASITSRLRFLGARVSGVQIALFGGLAASVNMMLSALILWVMAYPGIASDSAVSRTLYYLGFAIGGVGYSVPLGLLVGGVSVVSGFMNILPKWMVWIGLVIAIFGETSFLSLVFPKLLPLIPLTRFPGFIWLILAGFKLPKSLPTDVSFNR